MDITSETSIFSAFMVAIGLLVYLIVLDVYIHILAIIALYVIYKFISKRYVKKLDITEKGLFITGCDTGLWAVINNAGIAFNGDVEIASIETMKRIAEVNIYGMIRVTQACLPLIRKSKGRIINVTSVKGRLAIPTDAPYTMTKWAGEALSDSLRREMYRFGVKVIIIEPGHFGGITGMLTNESGKLATENLEEAWHNASSNVKSVYGRQYIDGLINNIRHVGEGGATNTEPVSDAMQDAVENVSPKYRYLVHGTNSSFDKYCVLAVLNQVLPEVLMDCLVRYTFPLPRTTEQNN